MTTPNLGHTLKKFDEELSTLRDHVLRMGGLVEEQLRRAVESLEVGDSEQAQDVIRGDREIDRIELKADEEVTLVLARRSPLGVDLRTVLTLAKTVGDLERVGDEAKKVARTSRDLLDNPEGGARQSLVPAVTAVARAAREMLRGALDALVRLDLARAEEIRRGDSAVNTAFRACIAQLSERMAADPGSIGPAVQLLLAAKGLERIGDHAKNIAMYVFYLVEGRDMRHPKVNPGA